MDATDMLRLRRKRFRSLKELLSFDKIYQDESDFQDFLD
jgi:hypothetical protein